MRQAIEEKLKEIEKKEKVTILMAAEAGSRAWGFASPDSDYDVRFIYVRLREDYLKLEGQRDVIEWQLDQTLDINGWDVQKALRLLMKSNPTVFEWCASPILYRSSEAFLKFKELATDYFSVKKTTHHYYNMARANYQNYLNGQQVHLKKYFYVLRPILAALWALDQKTAPPVPFHQLMKAQLEPRLIPAVESLLEQKKNTPEMGASASIGELNTYIEEQLRKIEEQLTSLTDDISRDWGGLNEFFFNLLDV